MKEDNFQTKIKKKIGESKFQELSACIEEFNLHLEANDLEKLYMSLFWIMAENNKPSRLDSEKAIKDKIASLGRFQEATNALIERNDILDDSMKEKLASFYKSFCSDIFTKKEFLEEMLHSLKAKACRGRKKEIGKSAFTHMLVKLLQSRGMTYDDSLLCAAKMLSLIGDIDTNNGEKDGKKTVESRVRSYNK